MSDEQRRKGELLLQGLCATLVEKGNGAGLVDSDELRASLAAFVATAALCFEGEDPYGVICAICAQAAQGLPAISAMVGGEQAGRDAPAKLN